VDNSEPNAPTNEQNKASSQVLIGKVDLLKVVQQNEPRLFAKSQEVGGPPVVLLKSSEVEDHDVPVETQELNRLFGEDFENVGDEFGCEDADVSVK
jgi:hypothetical protein